MPALPLGNFNFRAYADKNNSPARKLKFVRHEGETESE
jgi:hypothetical protein